ncbi:MAG: NAD(P)-dependent oxidoreductase [Bacilli bacterium]
MKIILFGANGKTGQHVIQQAIAQGIEVTAFVRKQTSISIQSELLHIVVGEATVASDVEGAMAGHDAVISCIGGPGTKRSSVITEITRNIVMAMQGTGVQRIVQMSSAGVHDELEGVIGKIISFLLRNPLADHYAAFELLQNSNLIYTLARPMGLTDGPCTETYLETQTGVPKNGRSIARADVAHFLLKSVTDTAYNGKSIGLSY